MPPCVADAESAGSAECNHTPTTASPSSPLASGLRNTCAVLWTNVRGTGAKPCAARVHFAGLLASMRWAITRGIACTTGVNALDQCPRHWHQCQGQAGPALTLANCHEEYFVASQVNKPLLWSWAKTSRCIQTDVGIQVMLQFPIKFYKFIVYSSRSCRIDTGTVRNSI